MERRKIIICSSILLAAVIFLPGCTAVQNPEETAVHPDLKELLQSDSVARRFRESGPQNPTAVESAIELSEKYAMLSEDAAALRRQNQQMSLRNQQLQNEVANIEKQLLQTQKELGEANDLIIEMRVELNNWKTDVLGFRNEMRNAETAQLEALLKILQVLGGEPKIELAQNEALESTVASLNPKD